MNKFTPERLMFLVSSTIIAILAVIGFYLVKAEIPQPFKHLAKAGHSHGLCFAFATIFYALLFSKLKITPRLKNILAWGNIILFVGPLGLLTAGLTQTRRFLTYTSIVSEGLFVILWLIMIFLLATRWKDE